MHAVHVGHREYKYIEVNLGGYFTYDRVYVNGSDFWPKSKILKVNFLVEYLIISDEKCIQFQEKTKFF